MGAVETGANILPARRNQNSIFQIDYTDWKTGYLI